MANWLGSEMGEAPLARIDLTPIIGVLAALIALFALSISTTRVLDTRAANLCGPVDGWGAVRRDVEVRVAEDGSLSVDGVRADAAQFDRFVSVAVLDSHTPYFHLHLANRARYQSMVSLLETLARHDARHFGFES